MFTFYPAWSPAYVRDVEEEERDPDHSIEDGDHLPQRGRRYDVTIAWNTMFLWENQTRIRLKFRLL